MAYKIFLRRGLKIIIVALTIYSYRSVYPLPRFTVSHCICLYASALS